VAGSAKKPSKKALSKGRERSAKPRSPEKKERKVATDSEEGSQKD
jgi:hypothetical protein